MTAKKKSSLRVFYKPYTKYLLVLAGFLLWITFFDQNSLIKGKKLSKEIHELEQEYSTFASEQKSYQERLKELRANPQKFAREEYLMLKENELVFILE